ncbi:hypothetical protein [Dactylosporangium sp. CA-139066]|uniref:hypothetical protein n=1 Tax=Dactylosporangium sp. CA-139066 TaxID=3239930 RepID=UPI003D8E147E
MTRPAKIALLITAAVIACVAAACGVATQLKDWLPGLAGCADPTKPTKTAVFTEPARIEQMYPRLKPIRSVHWQEREARPRQCPEIGPMDYEMNGLVVTDQATATSLAAAATPASAPDIPADLRPFAPPAPHWLDIGDGLLLDQAGATVYFTHFSSPRPSSPASSSSRPSSSSPAPPSSPRPS